MSLLSYYLVLKVQQHSSGTADAVIAESTSVNVNFTADTYETTSHAYNDYSARFIGGLTRGQISGDYLYASGGEQFSALFNKMNASEILDYELHRNGSPWLEGECILTSLGASGGNSDQLATGNYSMNMTASLSSAYNSTYQNIYNNFTDPPTGIYADAQNTFIGNMVNTGEWLTCDLFYMMAQYNQTDSLINWVNPGTFDLTADAGASFTSYRGWTSDGNALTSLDTGYEPALHATLFSLDSASFAVDVLTNVGETSLDIYAATTCAIYPRLASNAAGVRVNDGTFSYAANTSSIGLFIANRTVSTTKELWKNGVRIVNASVNSTSIPGAQFDFFQGGPAGSTREISMGFVGAGLTSDQISNITSYWQDYKDTIGI